MIKVRNKLFAHRRMQPNNIVPLKFSRSSEIELLERSLNQEKIILQIILRIVLIIWRKHGKEGIRAIINI